MKGLGKLKNLRLLQIYEKDVGWPRDNHMYLNYERTQSDDDDDCSCNNWMFDEDNFPKALRFLHWERYPGRSLPQTFRANNLVGLELPNSGITKLWESGERKVLKKLRFLDLRDSKLRTLDLGMTPNLENLDLRGCHDLTEIHAPTGCLERLVYLNILGCSRFRSSSFIQQLESPELLPLPKLGVSVSIFSRYAPDNQPKLSFRCIYVEEQAASLPLENGQRSVSLDLQPGTKLESVSGSFFGLQHLTHLTFEGCIPELPNDLDQLVNLEELNLESTHIKCLPDSICMLKHLKSLKFKSCQLLEELPRDLGRLVCLEKLTLFSTGIKHLPDSTCMIKNLKSLKLTYSQFLEELPRDLGQLECLEKLILCDCKSLKDIPNNISNMKRLKVLNIKSTGIRHLHQSISSLEGLRIVGSKAVLRSCASATEIQTSEDDETFCYIHAANNVTEAGTGLENLELRNRWRWSVVVLVVGLLVRLVIIQSNCAKEEVKALSII